MKVALWEGTGTEVLELEVEQARAYQQIRTVSQQARISLCAEAIDAPTDEWLDAWQEVELALVMTAAGGDRRQAHRAEMLGVARIF